MIEEEKQKEKERIQEMVESRTEQNMKEIEERKLKILKNKTQ